MEWMERLEWNGTDGTKRMEWEWFFMESVSIPFLFGNGPFHFSKNHCIYRLKSTISGQFSA
ncbi:hypothetical protein BpHYR1_014973 [Brachionus plicatilis]|uniref:Uncharacterized protein n=1 Tax=Brachionus plicatilis TaxID=10195 RepID=A0A3M7QU07_BRAPC|nr:hypothetical protein BpHYR1_014973 [Brachionus plicatilis]